jgi:hypothetical protein
MGAILPRWLLVPAETQPSLMHESRGLKRLTSGLAGHFPSGYPAQFVVDKHQQLVGSLRFSPLHLLEDKREVTHARLISNAAKLMKPEVAAGLQG